MTDTSKEAVERLAHMNETRMYSRPLSPLMTVTEPEPLGVETAKMLRTLAAERDAALAKGFWAGRACGGKAAQIKSVLHELGLEVKK